MVITNMFIILVAIIAMNIAAATASRTRSIQPPSGSEQRPVEALPAQRAPHSFRAPATSLGVDGRCRLWVLRLHVADGKARVKHPSRFAMEALQHSVSGLVFSSVLLQQHLYQMRRRSHEDAFKGGYPRDVFSARTMLT